MCIDVLKPGQGPLCGPQAAAQAGGKISDAASRQAVQMLVSLHLVDRCNHSHNSECRR